MPSSPKNCAILAAAGSRKTEHIIETALNARDGRVLIVTYTSENQRHIVRRIEQRCGVIPSHITVMGWFAFLVSHGAKPYQAAITGEPLAIGSLNFVGRRSRFTPKASVRFFLDAGGDMYRDGVADFVVCANVQTDGAVGRRLEKVYRYIFVDEVQDLAGYDLDVLDLLFASESHVMVVGDLRQQTLTTNMGRRNKKYRGAGLLKWFEERRIVCGLETRDRSYRSNQAVCDFADGLYPEFPRTRSVGVPATGHDGVFIVPEQAVTEYVRRYSPVTVLRNSRAVNTLGLPAMNIGVAKGSTFDRVLVFATKPMRRYLRDRDPGHLRARERLYVAVTRARFSVGFVVPGDGVWRCV